MATIVLRKLLFVALYKTWKIITLQKRVLPRRRCVFKKPTSFSMTLCSHQTRLCNNRAAWLWMLLQSFLNTTCCLRSDTRTAANQRQTHRIVHKCLCLGWEVQQRKKSISVSVRTGRKLTTSSCDDIRLQANVNKKWFSACSLQIKVRSFFSVDGKWPIQHYIKTNNAGGQFSFPSSQAESSLL